MLDLCIFLSWFRQDKFGESNIMDRGLITNMWLFASQDVNCWTGVVWNTCGLLWCFYQLFGLSFWRHPFTAEDLLVCTWCNAKFMQICSDEETNSSTVILDGLRVSKLLSNSNFRVNYFFKSFLENCKKRPHCIPKVMFQPSKSLSLSTAAWEGRAAVLHRLWNHRQEIYHDYSSLLNKKWILFIF